MSNLLMSELKFNSRGSVADNDTSGSSADTGSLVVGISRGLRPVKLSSSPSLTLKLGKVAIRPIPSSSSSVLASFFSRFSPSSSPSKIKSPWLCSSSIVSSSFLSVRASADSFSSSYSEDRSSTSMLPLEMSSNISYSVVLRPSRLDSMCMAELLIAATPVPVSPLPAPLMLPIYSLLLLLSESRSGASSCWTPPSLVGEERGELCGVKQIVAPTIPSFSASATRVMGTSGAAWLATSS
mmetsp:Transcript_407/g.923  ORF Transcript_407/g.923 Transcript_407/m.923 type:complete len:239 (+) Transcript_407:419-1135(+)